MPWLFQIYCLLQESWGIFAGAAYVEDINGSPVGNRLMHFVGVDGNAKPLVGGLLVPFGQEWRTGKGNFDRIGKADNGQTRR